MKSGRLLIGICAGLLLVAAGGWWRAWRYSRGQHEQLRALTTRIQLLEGEKARVVAKAEELARLAETQSEALMIRAKAIEGHQVYEDEVDRWLQRIDLLKGYLEKNPDKMIPELNLLTPKDWLNVTVDISLEFEADYRKALAKARGLTKRKTAAAVGDALKRAVAANGGKMPADVQDLAGYLAPGTEPAILQRLAHNPSGQIDGLKDLSGKTRYVLIEKPVDDVWDTITFYSEDGGWGTRGITNGEHHVTKAINEFTRATGIAPTTAQQLQPYLVNTTLDESTRDALFNALTTKLEIKDRH